MKLSVEFKDLNPNEIQQLWLKLNQLKVNIENRLEEPFVVKVDPIAEKFYILPVSEDFYFHFPVSYNLQNAEFTY